MQASCRRDSLNVCNMYFLGIITHGPVQGFGVIERGRAAALLVRDLVDQCESFPLFLFFWKLTN